MQAWSTDCVQRAVGSRAFSQIFSVALIRKHLIFQWLGHFHVFHAAPCMPGGRCPPTSSLPFQQQHTTTLSIINSHNNAVSSPSTIVLLLYRSCLFVIQQTTLDCLCHTGNNNRKANKVEMILQKHSATHNDGGNGSTYVSSKWIYLKYKASNNVQ